MPRKPLTPKQEAFVREYLIDLNATQAAIRAGYSAKTADRIGPELLGKTCVAEAIATAKAKRAERVEVTADMVLRELAILGFSDVRDFHVDHDGRLRLRHGAPDAAFRAVSSVKHKIRTDATGEVHREVEFKLWDKNAALEKIARHIRFYPPEKLEVTGEAGGPIQVEGANLDDLSEEQLAALAAKLAEARS